MNAFRVLAVLWGLATAGLLLVPSSALPGAEIQEPLLTAIELMIHLALFFGLASLAARGFASSRLSDAGSLARRARRRRVLALILAYCVLLEIAQIAVPGRGFELVDIAAGSLGAVLGLLESA